MTGVDISDDATKIQNFALPISFFSTHVVGPEWSDAGGWGRPAYCPTIQFADINGDGKTDLCGRSGNGIECYLSVAP